MKRKEQIEQEIQKTMSCFKNAKKIEAGPFFSARLQAKINTYETNKNRSWGKIFTMEYLQPALLLVFLLANILTATLIIGNNNAESLSRTEILKKLAEEYSFQQEEYSLLTFSE
jgi:hypothetical protein